MGARKPFPCAAAAAAQTPPPPADLAAARVAPSPAVRHDEVLALRELYLKLSNELHQDNLIHKDEFMWALFKANRDNLFAERVRSPGGCSVGCRVFLPPVLVRCVPALACCVSLPTTAPCSLPPFRRPGLHAV